MTIAGDIQDCEEDCQQQDSPKRECRCTLYIDGLDANVTFGRGDFNLKFSTE